MGRFKIWYNGTITAGWVYYSYRTTNGIRETKQDGNHQWSVGDIPSGAILL